MNLPGLDNALAGLDDGAALVAATANQGIGSASGFAMKVELFDGSFDYDRLQRLAETIAERARQPLDVQAVHNIFNAQAPQIEAVIDRTRPDARRELRLAPTPQHYVGSLYKAVQQIRSGVSGLCPGAGSTAHGGRAMRR